jgi:hypothetical protein
MHPALPALPALLALGLALPAAAQTVPVETGTLAGQQITLHLHPFLTPEDLALLRLVATNEQALALFVTRPGRHAALALAPAEGLVRAGQPVPSAAALADLPTPEAARAAALEGCERARREGPACVVVLEVAPAP